MLNSPFSILIREDVHPAFVVLDCNGVRVPGLCTFAPGAQPCCACDGAGALIRDRAAGRNPGHER